MFKQFFLPFNNSMSSVSTSTNGVVNGEVEEDKKTKAKNGISSAAVPDSKPGSPQSPSPPLIRDVAMVSCACECEKKVKDLEVAMDLISSWKNEVDRWMLSNFGFAVSINPLGPDIKSPEIFMPSTSTSSFVNENVDEAETNNGAADNVPNDCGEGPGNNDDNDLSFMNEESENVEISNENSKLPEIFGHFMLGNDSDESDGEGSVMSLGNLEAGEVEETEERSKRGKRRRKGDDSDSSCYTISSSSSESISSGEDDYMPKRGSGRGRGRGRGSAVGVPSSLVPNNKPLPQSIQGTSSSKVPLDHKTKAELVKHIRKRPGNIWECNICSFMLSDFNNMLLHIKYNHSTTAHTCSICRAIVLCRSPKDAMIHEAQCKAKPRPIANISRCPPPAPARFTRAKEFSIPTQKSIPIPTKKPLPSDKKEVDAQVDKFVSDLLGPGPSSRTIPSKTKKRVKQTGPLDVVTLSSDDES